VRKSARAPRPATVPLVLAKIVIISVPNYNFLATVNSYSSSSNRSARASTKSPKNEELHGPSSLAERRPVLFESAFSV
jgi:hypothetical protein